MLTLDDLVYDPVTHTTRTRTGQDVPHVTTILSETGITTDFAALAQRNARLAQSVSYGRDRGAAVHADCHAYDDDDIVWESVDERILPYVEAWARFRQDVGLKPLIGARERQIVHPLFWYTGILDGVFLREQALILADIKTGNPEDAGCKYQTAAYEAAWNTLHPDRTIWERWSVWLRPERRVPYTVTNYTAQSDAHTHFPKFQAFLITYQCQAKRRNNG
jgi:hypothetical protein